MCLAIPLRIVRIDEQQRALAARDGVELEVDVSLVPAARTGDWVIVHAGFAIQVLDPAEAGERAELFRGMAGAAAAEDAP